MSKCTVQRRLRRTIEIPQRTYILRLIAVWRYTLKVCIVNFGLSLKRSWNEYFYRLPTMLRKGNVFISVYLSAHKGKGDPCDHYPWCIGPYWGHGTSWYPSPTWDLTVQLVAPLPCPTSTDIWWLRSGREVGGTHVTGMLSCAVIFCIHRKLRSAI